MLTIKKMLELFELDTSKRVKIARHLDTRGVNLHELNSTNQFELYQSYQEKNRFKNCDYLISCLGLENNRALFIGVYEVRNTYNIDGFPIEIEVPYRGVAKQNSKYRYDLVKLPGFEELENRMVINWNGVASGWCVYLDTNDKEIIQLLPKGYVKEFPGYLDINISFRELHKIINNPDSNRLWHQMLSSVGGVYLIVDTTNGMQYVGSASGKEGLLGRWKEYIKNGHGNNKKLIEILENEPERIYKFKFTILKTLPNSLTQKEILDEEKKYKDKLGSRVYGLNLN